MSAMKNGTVRPIWLFRCGICNYSHTENFTGNPMAEPKPAGWTLNGTVGWVCGGWKRAGEWSGTGVPAGPKRDAAMVRLHTAARREAPGDGTREELKATYEVQLTISISADSHEDALTECESRVAGAGLFAVEGCEQRVATGRDERGAKVIASSARVLDR